MSNDKNDFIKDLTAKIGTSEANSEIEKTVRQILERDAAERRMLSGVEERKSRLDKVHRTLLAMWKIYGPMGLIAMLLLSSCSEHQTEERAKNPIDTEHRTEERAKNPIVTTSTETTSDVISYEDLARAIDDGRIGE